MLNSNFQFKNFYKKSLKIDKPKLIFFRDNVSPGWKFNHWELKGVPIRIEVCEISKIPIKLFVFLDRPS